MKTKGRREQNPDGVAYRETTRDERMMVITLRDEMSLDWSDIGRRLKMNRRTAQRVRFLLSGIMTVN